MCEHSHRSPHYAQSGVKGKNENVAETETCMLAYSSSMSIACMLSSSRSDIDLE